VVWFGEGLPETALNAAFAAAADCDVFLSVGTSSIVYPAAGLVTIAQEAGAMTIEVNPNPTEQSGEFTSALRGNAGVILPKLVELLTH
jgi:NAD-dependent deacetylase